MTIRNTSETPEKKNLRIIDREKSDIIPRKFAVIRPKKKFGDNLPGNARQNIEIRVIQSDAQKNVEIHNGESAEGIPGMKTMKNVDISRRETL